MNANFFQFGHNHFWISVSCIVINLGRERLEMSRYFLCNHLLQSAETKFSTKHCTDIQDTQAYKSWQSRTLRANSLFERRGLPPAKPKKMFILHRARHWSNQESSKPVFTLLKREWAILSFSRLLITWQFILYNHYQDNSLVCFDRWDHWTLVCLIRIVRLAEFLTYRQKILHPLPDFDEFRFPGTVAVKSRFPASGYS